MERKLSKKISQLTKMLHDLLNFINFKIGFLEKEILKEKNIDILEPQEISEAPKPKEMIDLEVRAKKRINK